MNLDFQWLLSFTTSLLTTCCKTDKDAIINNQVDEFSVSNAMLQDWQRHDNQ